MVRFSSPRRTYPSSSTPQTPSPLRTSVNANLMPVSPPLTSDNSCMDTSPPHGESSPLDKFNTMFQFQRRDPISEFDSSRRSTCLDTFSLTTQRPSPTGTLLKTQDRPHNFHSISSRTPYCRPSGMTNLDSHPRTPSSASTSSSSSLPHSHLSMATNRSKQRRRALFYENIAHRRENDRFASRGEDLSRMNFFAEQRRWERQLERSAPFDSMGSELLESWQIDGEGGGPRIASAGVHPVDTFNIPLATVSKWLPEEMEPMLDEDKMVEALAEDYYLHHRLHLHRQGSQPHHTRHYDHADGNQPTLKPSAYGDISDEDRDGDDYDQIFMQVLGSAIDSSSVDAAGMEGPEQSPHRQIGTEQGHQQFLAREPQLSSSMDLS